VVLASNCPEYHEPENETDALSLTVPSCQQVWAKTLSSGDVAIAMVNFDANADVDVHCDAACLGKVLPSGSSFHVRDMWTHKDIGLRSELNVTVAKGGGSVALLLHSV